MRHACIPGSLNNWLLRILGFSKWCAGAICDPDRLREGFKALPFIVFFVGFGLRVADYRCLSKVRDGEPRTPNPV